MMVVKIEIWPGGKEGVAVEIGRMNVTNISDLAEVSNYAVEVSQVATPRLNVDEFHEMINLDGHPRRDGPWRLVKRVLDRLWPDQRTPR